MLMPVEDNGPMNFSDEFLQTFYSTKRVLITGGLGFLGSSVANRLNAIAGAGYFSREAIRSAVASVKIIGESRCPSRLK